MKKLNYHELKALWLDFLREKGHAVIPSASIIPENDASTLFTTAGMQPLVPFLLGEPHPAGKRLANIQKCIRTNDIEEVGDSTHLTFFEMMGNWSLGDYFKKEKTAWSYEFLTNPKYLGLDKNCIHVTCFEGDKVAARDDECAKFWRDQGILNANIHFLPKSENWWALSSGTGPQGPCSEMFFETDKPACSNNCNPSCSCGRFVELGNDVYMQYIVDNAGGAVRAAKQLNVDTGWGLERILCFVNGYKSVYNTELFEPAIKLIGKDCSEARIIAEHVRASVVIIGDGVLPSNTGAGYVLRRLIRRAVRTANKIFLTYNIYEKLIDFFISYLGEHYINLKTDRDKIVKVFLDEVVKFEKTLETGLREFEKVIQFVKDGKLSGKTAFRLYETYGFPIELTQELVKEKNITLNMEEYFTAKEKHTQASQVASVGIFKGGLADSGVETARLHTATHILLAVLRETFGEKIIQKGANITPDRIRFDFSFDRKLENPELEKIEKRVNEIIAKKLPVTVKEMTVSDAKEIGAHGTFSDRYGERVKVYSIGDYSCEICGGPHAANTGELGIFKILKEESVASGVRRIRAILQKQ